MEQPNRRILVEELLFYMHEHPCCADTILHTKLLEEAKAVGWEIPT